MPHIHPLACVDPQARIAPDVRVGPFCFVGAGVTIAEGCVLHDHVTVLGPTDVGARNTFYPYAVIGAAPQDLKYKGGPTRVLIGADNCFREHVTIHRGTEVDRESGGVTRIGSHNHIMVGVHVAHDARIGNHTIIANQVQIAGHVQIDDHVNIGGIVGIHHFTTIGRFAFVTGMTRVPFDVPPFTIVSGLDADVRAINAEGLKRWNVPAESIAALKDAFKMVYGKRLAGSAGNTEAALAEIEANGLARDEYVRELARFLRLQLRAPSGRIREALRSDVPADRAAFYAAAEEATA